MPFWSTKSETPNIAQTRLMRQLQDLVEQNVVLDLCREQSKDIAVPLGSSRVLEFTPEQNALTVSCPTNKEGKTVPTQEGNALVVRFELNQGFYRFNCTVLRPVLYRPNEKIALQAIVVSVPESIQSANRRRHFRVEPMLKSMPIVKWRHALPEDQKNAKPGPWIDCKVCDVSGRGLGLWVAPKDVADIPANQRLDLSILLPKTTAPILLIGVVRQVIHNPKGNPNDFLAIEFDVGSKDPDACNDVIARYVTDCQRELARMRMQQ